MRQPKNLLADYFLWLLLLAHTTLEDIEVICSGFPRTGTESLMDALEILGYKTYYTKKLLMESYGAKHFEHWKYLVDSDCQSENAERLLREMLEVDAQATAISYLGGLICLEKLLELYPQAKVVHTQRTDPNVWVDSILGGPCVMFRPMELVGKVFTTPRRAFDFFQSFVNKIWFDQPPGTFKPNFVSCQANTEAMTTIYAKHNENIHSRVPPGRFLYFAKPEWSSLTTFLEILTPSIPYPNANSRKRFHREVGLIIGGPLVVLVLAVVLVIALVLKIRRPKTKKD